MIKIKLKKFLSAPPSPLDEGRVDDIKKKYPGKDDLVDQFSKAPGNNKYLDWMMRHHSETTPENMLNAIEKFDKYISQVKQKDINSYQDFESFYDVVDELRPPTKQLEREGTQKIYEDDEISIVRPLNQEASCKLGQNTKWCIAATKTQNYFNSYAKRGIRHYFVINKKLSKEDKNYKIAFSMSPDYENDFEMHNAEDTPLSSEGASKIYGQELYNKILGIVKGDLPKSQPSNIGKHDTFTQLKNYLNEEDVTEGGTRVRVSHCFFENDNLIDDEARIRRIIRKILNLDNEFVKKVISDILTATYHYTDREWEGLIKKYINDDAAKKILDYKVDSIISDLKTKLKHDYDRSDYDNVYGMKRFILNTFSYTFRNSKEAGADFLNKLLALNNDDINIILQEIYVYNNNLDNNLPPLSSEGMKKISDSYDSIIIPKSYNEMLETISNGRLEGIKDYRITKSFDHSIIAYFYGENVEKSNEIIDALSKVPGNLDSFITKEFISKNALIKHGTPEFLTHVLDKIESYGARPYLKIFAMYYEEKPLLLDFIKKLIIPFYERSKIKSNYENYMTLIGEKINEAGEEKPIFLKAIKDAAGDKYSEILKMAKINDLSESKLFTFNKDKKVFKLLR